MRKLRKMAGLAGFCLLLCTAVPVLRRLYVQRQTMQFAARLGSGINIGNALDATGIRSYRPDASDLAYETSWGNPEITKELMEGIREAGFQTVRIPVTWEEHIDEHGKIREVWIQRVRCVVDLALSQGLYVILNTHHETWIDLTQEEQEQTKKRFACVWGQIAQAFREYGEELLFEGMNEPRLRGSEEEWTEGTMPLRSAVNDLNRIFADTVRASGGENKTRYLLVCPYGNNTGKEALEALEIPDERVMVSVHMYEPYWFCQDEEGEESWPEAQNEEKEQIEETFCSLHTMFVRRGIPVVLTEFGCVDKGNTKSRREWLIFYKTLADQNGIACIWWDNGSSYRLIDRKKGEQLYPTLIDVLIKP